MRRERLGFHCRGGGRIAGVLAACALGIWMGLLGVGSAGASNSQAGTNKCISTSSSACRVMPGSGTFTLPIPGTPASLVGVGTPDRAGKQIVIDRVPLVCKSLGGIGIKITTPRTAGLLPPLHWSNGTLYARNPSSGRCVGIASPALAAAPGVYQVVPGHTLTHMPASGGAVPEPAPGLSLVLLACLLVLMGAVTHALRRSLW